MYLVFTDKIGEATFIPKPNSQPDAVLRPLLNIHNQAFYVSWKGKNLSLTKSSEITKTVEKLYQTTERERREDGVIRDLTGEDEDYKEWIAEQASKHSGTPREYISRTALSNAQLAARRKCPSCGAPYAKNQKACDYCRSALD